MPMAVGVVCQSCGRVVGTIEPPEALSHEEISKIVNNFFCEHCVGGTCETLGITPKSAEQWETVFKKLRNPN